MLKYAYQIGVALAVKEAALSPAARESIGRVLMSDPVLGFGAGAVGGAGVKALRGDEDDYLRDMLVSGVIGAGMNTGLNALVRATAKRGAIAQKGAQLATSAVAPSPALAYQLSVSGN